MFSLRNVRRKTLSCLVVLVCMGCFGAFALLAWEL